MWSSGTVGNSVNVQITYGFNAVPPAPTCACGKITERTVTYNDGRKVQVCVECGERIMRDGAIARAEAWLNAAFVAVGLAQRARLYKQLAIVFHPRMPAETRG